LGLTWVYAIVDQGVALVYDVSPRWGLGGMTPQRGEMHGPRVQVWTPQRGEMHSPKASSGA